MSGDAALLALEGRGFPENAGIATALWQDSSKEIAAALHSPFVKGLADGSLPRCVCGSALSQVALQQRPSSDLMVKHA